jgi:hypothetical protein
MLLDLIKKADSQFSLCFEEVGTMFIGLHLAWLESVNVESSYLFRHTVDEKLTNIRLYKSIKCIHRLQISKMQRLGKYTITTTSHRRCFIAIMYKTQFTHAMLAMS